MRAPCAIPMMVAGIALGCGGSGLPPSIDHPLAGRPAPAFHEEDVNGDGIVHVPLRGPGRVTVVDFWASWCTACRDTMPALDAIWRDHHERGLSVVGVSIDEDLGQVHAFVRHLGTTFPLVMDGGQRIASMWGVRRIPITFVLDDQGVVRWVGRDPASVRTSVEALLGGDAKTTPRDAFAD